MMNASTVEYYKDSYWNDLPAINEYLNRRATGNPHWHWMDYFKEKYASIPFKEALVIGCGNGWVERELYDRGIALHFDAFDWSETLLESAESQRGNRPIHYFQANYNTFVPTKQYDLVVNHAALHHVARLYRLLNLLANALTPDGILLNWDYVGPNRNQYSRSHLQAMQTVNLQLPERFRSPHSLRSSLLSALVADPTEAVHAEEILQAVGHFFEFLELKKLGGAIAYQLLWNNIAEFAKSDPEATQALHSLIQRDEQMTETGELPCLFCFFVCQPKQAPASFAANWLLSVWEPLRETIAPLTFNVYPVQYGAVLADVMRAIGNPRAWVAARRVLRQRFGI